MLYIYTLRPDRMHLETGVSANIAMILRSFNVRKTRKQNTERRPAESFGQNPLSNETYYCKNLHWNILGKFQEIIRNILRIYQEYIRNILGKFIQENWRTILLALDKERKKVCWCVNIFPLQNLKKSFSVSLSQFIDC